MAPDAPEKNNASIMEVPMLDDALYRRYLDALIAGYRTQCHKIVETLNQARVDVKDMYTHLFQ